jgi:two-component system cell cycle sensor histidine kinase/response regulator CckA
VRPVRPPGWPWCARRPPHPRRRPPPSSSGATNAFRLLAGAGAAGFFDLDLARGQVHLSPTWKSMLGYTPDGIADTVAAWRDLMHPDDSAAAPDRVGRRTPPGSRTISVEYRMRHRQGHWVWIHCVGLQVVGSRGVVDRVAGLHLDISERKELEETLVASETRFNALATEGPLAAFELDFARGQCWFSPAWERLLGFAPGEVPATAASFTAALPAAAAGVGAAEWLLQPAPDRATFLAAVNLRARDGREVPVLLGVNRVISRKRELVRAFGFACPDPARPAAAPAGLPSGPGGARVARRRGGPAGDRRPRAHRLPEYVRPRASSASGPPPRSAGRWARCSVSSTATAAGPPTIRSTPP